MLKIEPSRHMVLDHDWPWLRWLRTELAEDLFVYRHLETETFVLCQWVERGGGLCNELEAFKASPTSMWPEDLLHWSIIRDILRSQHVVAEERERERRDKASDERRKREAALSERASTTKWLRSRGMYEEAKQIDTGEVPWADPSEGDPELTKERTDQFLHMARKG